MNFEELWLMREIGTGMIAFLLAVISYALGLFIYYHRVSLTVEDREARDAAIGLVVIFGALTVRAGDLWSSVVANRLGWTTVDAWSDSTMIYLGTTGMVVVGVILTVKAFHPWPLWFLLTAMAVAIPLGVGIFLG